MASEIKVNKVSPATGTALQISDSGDTVTLPSGATLTIAGTANVTGTLSNNGTATGFGAIDWQTSDVKTSTFTAVAGKGYFVNTTGGAITVNLPAGSAGTQIGLVDYAGTWDTNACTIAPNGSEKIEGVTQDIELENERESITLIYQDSTQGWIAISNSDGKVTNPKYISASGGTETTSGNFKIHTFTSSGTFTVSSVGNSAGGGAVVSYQVVAGGGGGGTNNPASSTGGGGGGGGGYREGKASNDSYTASPLNAPAGLTVSAQGYPITIGGGGTGTPGATTEGGASVFSTISSAGGGYGASYNQGVNASAGGSGGGGAYARTTGGSGNTPPVSPPQGSDGGTASRPAPSFRAGAGGGGATAVGGNTNPLSGGHAGAGATSHIPGSPTALAGGGGGGGGAFGDAGGGDGANGGGNGATNDSGNNGSNGTANTGGGGGGACGTSSSNGGTGGSGKVVIRYKYQN
jgi:hypothetical protein